MITKLPSPALEIIELFAQNEIGTLTQEDIREAVPGTSQKSVRYAIRRLLENAIIYRVPNLFDMRSVSYRLASSSELSTALEKLSDKVFKEVLIAMGMDNLSQEFQETIKSESY